MIEHVSKWLELVLLSDCNSDIDVKKQACECELVSKSLWIGIYLEYYDDEDIIFLKHPYAT
jgi:hypothetical protein